MKTPRVLLLYEDHRDWEVLRTTIIEEGCEVQEAPIDTVTGNSVAGNYCLVLFDIQRITARIRDRLKIWRERFPQAMMIVAGGRTSQANRLAFFETGIDAYLRKPIAVPELRARVRAAARRFQLQASRRRSFTVETGTIDLDARVIRNHASHTRLTPTECVILELLAMNMNQTVTFGEMVRTVWGTDPQKGAHSLRFLVRQLRGKLEPDPAQPRYLVTEPAVGYRLQLPEGGSIASMDR